MKPGLRRPLVAGNWKLHKTQAESRALIAALQSSLKLDGGASGVEVVVAPVFTALSAAREQIGASAIGLAAQDCFEKASGAFTGEVSVPLLADAGCSHVIVGHSERRELFGETDASVARKTVAVLEGGLTPIVCVGESLAIRESGPGKAEAHVTAQVDAVLAALDARSEAERGRVVLAYEPIWAIGTGRTATPADAQAVHAAIRARLAQRWGALAERTRILYGGSVKPDNAVALMREPDVDGALVGGASLDAQSFTAIAAAARA